MIVLNDDTTLIFKNATQKDVDELAVQLSEARTELSSLSDYARLKENEIMYLNERVTNETMKKKITDKDLELAKKEVTALVNSHKLEIRAIEKQR